MLAAQGSSMSDASRKSSFPTGLPGADTGVSAIAQLAVTKGYLIPAINDERARHRTVGTKIGCPPWTISIA